MQSIARIVTLLAFLIGTGKVAAQPQPSALQRLELRLQENRNELASVVAQRPPNRVGRPLRIAGGVIGAAGLLTAGISGMVWLVASGARHLGNAAAPVVTGIFDGAAAALTGYDPMSEPPQPLGESRAEERSRLAMRVGGYVAAGGAVVLLTGMIWTAATSAERRPYDQRIRALKLENRDLRREWERLSLTPSLGHRALGLLATYQF
jgi:hypothetical protein